MNFDRASKAAIALLDFIVSTHVLPAITVSGICPYIVVAIQITHIRPLSEYRNSYNAVYHCISHGDYYSDLVSILTAR